MKPLSWIGSSQDDLRSMPRGARQTFGYALYLAQTGKKHESAKPLQGFDSAGVLEVVKNEQGGTYRAVYTVRLKKAIYVLHCFKRNRHPVEARRKGISIWLKPVWRGRLK
jgi:phage-related protein